MEFFESHFLWLDAVIAASFCAAAAAVVGVHAILRRVVFLPAALSQLAGLGVVASFWLAHMLPEGCGAIVESPRFFAILFAIAGAVALGLFRESRGATREWWLGAVYVASSALVLLVGGYIPQELHDVNDILFGNAIAIERAQMFETAAISFAVIAVHGAMARPFWAVAFDAGTAEAHGVPVRGLEALLFLTMGLAAATTTRVVGALPAFAFAVFPSAAALALVRDARAVVAVAALLGALCAFLGYWASFELSIPTGASMAVVAGAVFLVARGAATRLKRRRS
ncbi:MAG: metal ABC transporter permease [Proteobacteria bacterium]|jgi:ABC-type Mn2+/Zn2+ transport system permease subunit|nr:metal ABC transporter permease [Pseudomonadota bacterium]